MGAGRSRMNLKQCSCAELQDLGLSRVHTEFNNDKRSCKNYKAELCNHPNKYVLTRMPTMSTNNHCTCNTALGESKYSLEALTAEEQLDVVERVFREKNRKQAERKKRYAKETPPPICCNCVCTCGGGGREPEQHRIERRNGLQKVDRCDGGCQCVLCCENNRMGELSEAEAIADAIHEYCCKERERSGGGGKSACKYCACKQQLTAKNGQRRRQVIEQDVEDDDEDEDAHTEEVEEDEEVEVVERKKIMKEEIVIEERIESRRREDNLTEEETIEESARPRQRRKSNESAMLNPENGKRSSIDQKHQYAESARPRQRRKSNESAVINSENGKRSSIDQKHQYAESARPRQRRKSNESAVINSENGKRSSIDQKHAKSCKCCVCRNETAAKESNRYSDSDDDMISLDNIELEVQTDVISTRREQWDETSAPQSRRPSQENTIKENKCCTCDKGTTTDFIQEAEVLMKRKRLVSQSSEEINPTPPKPAKEGRRSIDEEAIAKPQRRLSEKPRSERPTRQEQTHDKSCKCCVCQRKLKENEKLLRNAEMNRKPKQRESQADHEPESTRSLPRRNEEDNTMRRRSINNEQQPKVRDTPPRRSMQDESRTQQEEMAIAIERQPRRQSSKPQETPKDGRVVESETEDTDQQPAMDSDSEAETAKPQRCYCFKHKRSQRKQGEENGCRKDCTCTRTKEQTATAAAAKNHRSERRSSSAPASGEPREPQRRRRNSEQVASNNKEKECQTDCKCKKTKGVPLTKCCKCTDEMVETMARQHEEDMKRRKLAEILAERLQKRAELQIALQKRLQQQMRGKQKQQRCCCKPQPFCMPCCEPMTQPEPIPITCCEVPACCCQPTPCYFETPACCYEPPPCYEQECPCCCQPMPFSYSASCSYPKPGSC